MSDKNKSSSKHHPSPQKQEEHHEPNNIVEDIIPAIHDLKNDLNNYQ